MASDRLSFVGSPLNILPLCITLLLGWYYIAQYSAYNFFILKGHFYVQILLSFYPIIISCLLNEDEKNFHCAFRILKGPHLLIINYLGLGIGSAESSIKIKDSIISNSHNSFDYNRIVWNLIPWNICSRH